MKKLLLFLLTPLGVCSQNLVPNGSFEEYQACPTTMGEITKAIGWKSFGGSPDYFNSCATLNGFNDIGVPRNSFGYQLPYDGNAYAGFFGYYVTPASYREYIAIELTESLKMGKFYTISFYVSLGYNPYYTNLGFNNIGVQFLNQEFSESNPFLVINSPNLNNSEILDDTSNWIKMSWTFSPDSEYRYIAIGNFSDNSNTDTIQLPTLITIIRGYTYIDNIELYECDSLNGYSIIDLHKLIYPNPFSNAINISPNIDSKIEIRNSNGDIVLSEENKNKGHPTSIDTSKLNNGNYFLSAIKNNQKTTIKILKQ